jgi:hypothetical protein
MPKRVINDLIITRDKYHQQLVDIFKKYYIKFIKRLYDTSLREFQKKLLKCADWSDDKLDKEYEKFLKFVSNNYDLNEEELTKILHIVHGLNIKIITAICEDIEINAPKLIKFWYKCLKRVCKYFYEHPKTILSETDFKRCKIQIEESINWCLQKFIPLKEIMNAKRKKNSDKYNFNNGLDDTESLVHSRDKNSPSKKSIKEDTKFKVTLESDSNIDGLRYISSEEFENEYYISDKEISNIDDKEISHEKHIKVPIHKLKKQSLNKKKSLIDEQFFDNI